MVIRVCPRVVASNKKKKKKKSRGWRISSRNTLDKRQRPTSATPKYYIAPGNNQQRNGIESLRKDPSEKIFAQFRVNRAWFERVTTRACKRHAGRKGKKKKVDNLWSHACEYREICLHIRCPYVYAEKCAKSRCFISIIWESTSLGCCRQRYGCFYFACNSEHSLRVLPSVRSCMTGRVSCYRPWASEKLRSYY